MKDGEPEYAILPYAEYQALLKASRAQSASTAPVSEAAAAPAAAPATPAPASNPLTAIAQQAAQNTSDDSLVFSGNRVAELRGRKGLDSKTLARGIGISPLYLAQIESGERMPGDAIWHNIARELQVSQDELKVAGPESNE